MMTAAGWSAVMTGEVDEVLAYSDWLIDKGLEDVAALARQLPELATAVADMLETYEEATYVEFRITAEGGKARHGYRVGDGRTFGFWLDHDAASLIAGGTTAYPAAAWIEKACGLVLCTVWSMNSQEGYARVRFKRRK